MTQSTQTVDHLTRVKLSIGAGSAQTDRDVMSDEIFYEFVVGIGSKGYSPFEYELLGKSVGQNLQIILEAGEVSGFFEHLHIPSGLDRGAVQPILLYVRIDQIETPNQAEIIRAMAEGAACGDQCCGTHA